MRIIFNLFIFVIGNGNNQLRQSIKRGGYFERCKCSK